ncbi:MAG TPA: hypothetical protein VNG33_07710 [Polyangiaceae bacterium]|nr:hypothetical protein [Polyangiaceae bacterium]
MKNVWSKSLTGVAAVLSLSQTAAAAEPAAPGTTAAQSPAPAAAPTETASAAQPDEARAENKAQDARLKALEEQLALLKQQLAAKEKSQVPKAEASSPSSAPVSASPASRGARPHGRHWDDGLQVSAYAQAQLEFHQDSEDQLAPGGQPLNQNRFLLRRGRLKVESKHRYAEFLLEVDGNTVKGPSFGVHRAEVSAVYRGADAAVSKAPLVAVTAGVLVPSFGRELQESARTRPFMERSLASRAFFPSEPDVGLRLSGKLGFFEYGVAVVNGEPAGQPAGFPLRDPNSSKDIIGRLGVAADVSSVVSASGGVSLLNGKGTFRGSDGVKNTITWTDLNEDGQISNVELTATPGAAPRRSQNFEHWAVGADADVAVKTGLGQTELQAEVVVASNLDRGLFISDPVTGGHDARQFGYYVALLQDVTRHALLGVRYDYYDPQADVLGVKSGKIVPTKASVKTISPLIGWRLPGGVKLLGEWDLVRDHLATDNRGVPADRKNNVVTFRLQGEL